MSILQLFMAVYRVATGFAGDIAHNNHAMKLNALDAIYVLCFKSLIFHDWVSNLRLPDEPL
jgi:hypothetical protein